MGEGEEGGEGLGGEFCGEDGKDCAGFGVGGVVNGGVRGWCIGGGGEEEGEEG